MSKSQNLLRPGRPSPPYQYLWVDTTSLPDPFEWSDEYVMCEGEHHILVAEYDDMRSEEEIEEAIENGEEIKIAYSLEHPPTCCVFSSDTTHRNLGCALQINVDNVGWEDSLVDDELIFGPGRFPVEFVVEHSGSYESPEVSTWIAFVDEV